MAEAGRTGGLLGAVNADTGRNGACAGGTDISAAGAASATAVVAAAATAAVGAGLEAPCWTVCISYISVS